VEHQPRDSMAKGDIAMYRAKECSPSFFFELANEKRKVLASTCVPNSYEKRFGRK